MDDLAVSVLPARALRGLAVIAASVVAMTATAVAYVHPAIPGGAAPATASLSTGYHVTAIDFVDNATGWVVADFDSGHYAVLHTADAGFSWSRQLAGVGQGHAQYLKFFDAAVGVLGLLGKAPKLLRTADGGKSWTALPLPPLAGTVLSWSFVDSYFGWMLVSGTSPLQPLPAYLYRTTNGGESWQNLGVPAPAPDQVFQVSFSYFTTGWLTSANAGPYAYKTSDYGDTWQRVPLPAPAGGWPLGGAFMVAVQPTSGTGAVTSVVFVPKLQGRKGQGATIRDFPPLTVVAFDGGRPVTYTYATAIGLRNLGPIPQSIAPNQVELGTLDNGSSWGAIGSPQAGGAIGYSDATSWWWVGAGRLATSHDGGASWSTPQAVPAREPSPGMLQVLDGRHAWSATSDGSRPMLEATDDGGLRWRLVPLPPIPG